MFTLTATDHREGAFGDVVTASLDTLEACHALANELNCGIYTTDDGTADTVWESDGTTVTAIERIVRHYFVTESDAITARCLFMEDGYTCNPVAPTDSGLYVVGVVIATDKD